MKRTLPFILTDTSMFLNLAGAQLATDYELPADHEQLGQVDVAAVIDRLTEGPNGRTLIMTRKILNELFPTAGGRLDFMPDADGKPMFPLGAGPLELYYPNCMPIYDVFSRYAQQGKLRCYESFDAMALAGEVANPRGGIVIVDTDPPNERRSMPADGRRTSPNRDYYNQVYAPNEVRRFSEKSRRANFNKGDDTLMALGTMLRDEARLMGTNPDFMLVTNDLDLTRRMIALSTRDFMPVVSRPYEVLWAMEQDKQPGGMALEQGVAAGFTNAMAHERAKTGRQLVNNIQAFTRGVTRATHWLQDSRTDAPAPLKSDVPSPRPWTERCAEPPPELPGPRGR
ncbi:MAG: hypothetical protein DI582_06540 [Azospirillum brasilense]|nr:MAG: hypothetical protein DI582_06540 [Azospirillum brasilense]